MATSVQSLPNELLLHLFSFLDNPALRQVTLTNKCWSAVAQELINKRYEILSNAYTAAFGEISPVEHLKIHWGKRLGLDVIKRMFFTMQLKQYTPASLQAYYPDVGTMSQIPTAVHQKLNVLHNLCSRPFTTLKQYADRLCRYEFLKDEIQNLLKFDKQLSVASSNMLEEATRSFEYAHEDHNGLKLGIPLATARAHVEISTDCWEEREVTVNGYTLERGRNIFNLVFEKKYYGSCELWRSWQDPDHLRGRFTGGVVLSQYPEAKGRLMGRRLDLRLEWCYRKINDRLAWKKLLQIAIETLKRENEPCLVSDSMYDQGYLFRMSGFEKLDSMHPDSERSLRRFDEGIRQARQRGKKYPDLKNLCAFYVVIYNDPAMLKKIGTQFYKIVEGRAEPALVDWEIGQPPVTWEKILEKPILGGDGRVLPKDELFDWEKKN